MGAYTFSQFKDYLQLRLGERDDITDKGGVNFLEVWTNAAYRQLTTQNRFWQLKLNYEFPELFTDTSSDTTDGTAYISTPSGCLYVTEVYDGTNDRKLDKISWKKYVGYTDRSDTNSEGEPTEWVRRGGNIYFHPTPDDTYSMAVHHRKIPDKLSKDTDTTEIGAEWDEAILELAAYKAHSWLVEYDKAERAKVEFTNLIQGLIGIYDEEEKDMDAIYLTDPVYFDRE